MFLLRVDYRINFVVCAGGRASVREDAAREKRMYQTTAFARSAPEVGGAWPQDEGAEEHENEKKEQGINKKIVNYTIRRRVCWPPLSFSRCRHMSGGGGRPEFHVQVTYLSVRRTSGAEGVDSAFGVAANVLFTSS